MVWQEIAVLAKKGAILGAVVPQPSTGMLHGLFHGNPIPKVLQ